MNNYIIRIHAMKVIHGIRTMFSRKLDAQEYHHRAPTNVIRRIPHPLQSCRRTTTDILEFVVRNRDKHLLCTAEGVTIP